MKTLTPVQQQRRDRILSGARQQLSKHGYEGLNMRDLAVVAEVSTSTLYNLYQGKDALILAALEDLLAEINTTVVSTGVTGLDRSLKRIEVIADQIVETPKYAEAMGKMLFNAEPSHPIVQALIGAPVLAIIPYDTEEEAIEIANDSIFGLSGAVWSADPERAKAVARQIRTGQVSVNGGGFNVGAPFGGYKQSGNGRELGAHGLTEYIELKSMQL